MSTEVTGWDLWQWSRAAKSKAVAAQINPNEVDLLLEKFASLDRLSLRLESFKSLSEISLAIPWQSLVNLWEQRLVRRVPLQYLIGTVEWRHFSLAVSPAVLIPRPETELIVELAVSAVGDTPNLRRGHWVDMGTGSGAIAFGLSELLPEARIHAVDASEAALAIAQKNAVTLSQGGKLLAPVHFYQGSWWEPLEHLKKQVNGMVSNPPYIPANLMTTLQPEVRLHEPHLALEGGEDGLDCIRHLIHTAPTYLKPGGVWLVEMMMGQAEAVTQLLNDHGHYCRIQIFQDLAGIDRFVLARLR